jgi:hypothetical protein
MTNVIDIKAAREKRQRRITTGSRREARAPIRPNPLPHETLSPGPVKTCDGREGYLIGRNRAHPDELFLWVKGDIHTIHPCVLVCPLPGDPRA